MTGQLFAAPKSGPIARDRDPVTSQLAAREVRESGIEDTQCAEVLRALKQTPGLTSRELAVRHGIERYTVARRLPTLRERGLATTDGMRKCAISGRMVIVWKAT